MSAGCAWNYAALESWPPFRRGCPSLPKRATRRPWWLMAKEPLSNWWTMTGQRAKWMRSLVRGSCSSSLPKTTVLSLRTMRSCWTERSSSRSIPASGVKAASGSAGVDREAAVEVGDEGGSQVGVGVGVGADPGQRELLGQAPLDGPEGPLAAPPGLRGAGQDVADAQRPEHPGHLAVLLLVGSGRRPCWCGRSGYRGRCRTRRSARSRTNTCFSATSVEKVPSCAKNRA